MLWMNGGTVPYTYKLTTQCCQKCVNHQNTCQILISKCKLSVYTLKVEGTVLLLMK